MKTLKTIAAVLVAGAGLLGASAANAVSTYSDTFYGVTFTIEATSATSFTLRIEGALSTTDPEWDNATQLAALGFKDLGINFQGTGVSASLSSDPPGDPATSWNYVQGELDADGCKDPNGQKGVICFTGVPPLAITDDMLFTVTITGATLNIDSAVGPHVKLQFLDKDGNKEGSLLSENLTGGDGGPDGDVPEPGTLALLGLGLLGLGLGARRKRV